ncbi:hemin transporter [Mumia zhuanghuii]|uniref:nitric oxide dioxygenase n=2 Tax=Mumia TaxID=1546255 RepID=A0ABW1QFP1_9ACTN|nr:MULTISPECIES: globin domain-containing protein [Mumia]KAA1424598.1 hemin transporter [Mumia zhuanghuii]
MLSATSTEVVRATLPVVGGAIGEITPNFYRRMFAAHPELLRDTFNRGNQAQGDQQRALAGAIAAYATLLVDPDAPPPAALMSRIANKHASLGILPEQYAIVHEHLFAAIVEVLGDAVTPEVAAAWDEVYWHMADALIAAEKGLYAGAGVEAGDVWRELVVTERQLVSTDTVAFTLATSDGVALPTFLPGQYVSVQVELPDGAHQIRQYSLSAAPGAGAWRIGVRRIAPFAADGTPQPAGEVSNHLYDNVFEGDRVRVSLPFGDLTLDDSSDPLVLVSAGIGVTPILGMLDHLAAARAERRVEVIHADRTPARHAHRAELSALVERIPGATLHTWYEELGTREPQGRVRAGRVDLEAVEVPADATAYLCGPLPFMLGVRDALVARAVPAERIHYEVFGPDTWIPSAS